MSPHVVTSKTKTAQVSAVLQRGSGTLMVANFLTVFTFREIQQRPILARNAFQILLDDAMFAQVLTF